LLVAVLVGIAVYYALTSGKLRTDLGGNQYDKNAFNTGIYEGVFVEPEKPEDPFWMLFMGTDDRAGYEVPRTDTLILARVDQQAKKVAMISIPRDTYVNHPEYGEIKINAAYTYAELNEAGSGPAQTVRTVSNFAGVDIAYFAQINFPGLEQLVNDLDGVVVDVPVDIINDPDSGGLDIYAGLQKLDGAHALTFCRARNPFLAAGDYQRQANQRTFLQALAKQVLAADLPQIATAVTNMAQMTFTNMDLSKIIKVAQGMRGMEESNIYTYYVPSAPDNVTSSDGTVISYVVADNYAWQQMIASLNAGEYPDHQEGTYAGVIPNDYLPTATTTTSDQLEGQTSSVTVGDYVIDVRNGYGYQGSATSVSDMLVLAGYRRGEIGNANSYVYETTLVVYKDEAHKAVAEDIRKRLGYGKIVDSLGQYTFSGDILVVVGGDFATNR
jgi:LCP family protein required for cell wall assembly